MTVYAAPHREICFVLEELAGLGEVAALPGFEDATPETVAAILDQAGRFGAEVLAPTNVAGDRAGCLLENGAVTTPAPFAEAYRRFCADGWHGMTHHPDWGGHGLPRLVATAASEIWHASNVALALCPTLTDSAAEALAAHGDAGLKDRYLRKLVTGEWTGAMVMTEPQAGSDIGALTCRAVPDDGGDGYRLFGQKIFISWGEHDLTDNIVHMVLARLPDAPAGSRGISLFLVPKFLPDESGAPGPRNDMRCVGLERKLGLHGSPTCLMQYGEGDGARGWLVGEPHRGLATMFTMMNTARLAVGHEGIGIAERAFQQACAYAAERRQGRADASADDPAPIVAHGDVRRMLIAMRARVEAMRALALTAARSVDLAAHHPADDIRAAHQARAGLLTPMVKAWCTDGAVAVASLDIQVHGGAGYIEETGAAQHLRDARITPIYEGTNGIQALDLLRRKVAADDGDAAFALIAELRAGVGDSPATLDALGLLEDVTHSMIAAQRDAPDSAGAGAAPYLDLFATVAGGALMARAAAIATRRAAGGDDGGFYSAKVATAAYYAAAILPRARGLAAAATEGASAVPEAGSTAFTGP